MKNIRIKRVNYYLISILLVFFLLLFNFYFFSFLLREIFNNVSSTYLEKNLSLIINDSVNELIKKENINEFFILHLNDDKEILYVDYDLKHSYVILEKVTNILKDKLSEKSIVYFLPIGMAFKNTFLLNYGPKIGFKVDYLDSLLTNIYTKVTNYGLNNALLEIYIKVKLNGMLITPLKKYEKSIDHDILIASKVISGRVPTFYGDSIKSSSLLFDISIK